MRAQPGSAEDADKRGGLAASALVGDPGKSRTPRAMKIFRYQRPQWSQVLRDCSASKYLTGTAVSLWSKTSRTNEGLVRRTRSPF